MTQHRSASKGRSAGRAREAAILFSKLVSALMPINPKIVGEYKYVGLVRENSGQTWVIPEIPQRFSLSL